MSVQTSHEGRGGFSSLPYEIVGEICEYLPFKERCRLAAVSRKCHEWVYRLDPEFRTYSNLLNRVYLIEGVFDEGVDRPMSVWYLVSIRGDLIRSDLGYFTYKSGNITVTYRMFTRVGGLRQHSIPENNRMKEYKIDLAITDGLDTSRLGDEITIRKKVVRLNFTSLKATRHFGDTIHDYALARRVRRIVEAGYHFPIVSTYLIAQSFFTKKSIADTNILQDMYLPENRFARALAAPVVIPLTVAWYAAGYILFEDRKG